MEIPDNLPSAVPTGGINEVGYIMLGLVGLLVLGGILFSLWQMLTSGLTIIVSKGEKERLQKAQNKFKFSIIGLVAIFISFIIITAFSVLAGADIIPFF